MYRLYFYPLFALPFFIGTSSGFRQEVIHEHHEEQLLLHHLNHSGLLHKMAVARTLRIYIKKDLWTPGFGDEVFYEGAMYVGPPLNLSKCELSPDLYPIKDWLRLHTEYHVHEYVYLRLKNDFTVVPSAKEADICFGGCDEANEIVPAMTNQAPVFLVPQGKETSIFSCSKLDFGIEFDGVKGIDYTCHVAAPYVLSIYSPNASAVAPWNLPLTRRTLLGYYGGLQRGFRRGEIVHEMMNYSALHYHEIGDQHFATYFSAPREVYNRTNDHSEDSFFAEAWNLYAHSYFSWQPAGDTPTRRAFYDSWLFGCIPVVSGKPAWFYNLLFKSQLFSGPHFAFDDIAVVLPWDLPEDGASILQYLSKIPLQEIRTRQSKLRSIAPLMQWGWKTKHNIDPFLLFLATSMK